MFRRLNLSTPPRDLANTADMGTCDDVLRYLLERLALLEDRVATLERAESERDGAEAAADVGRPTRSPSTRTGAGRPPAPVDPVDPDQIKPDLVTRYRDYIVDWVGPIANPGRLAKRLAVVVHEYGNPIPGRPVYHLPTFRHVAARILADAIDDPPAGETQIVPHLAGQWARDRADELAQDHGGSQSTPLDRIEFNLWVDAAVILEAANR